MKNKRVIKTTALSVLIAAIAAGGTVGGIYYKNNKKVVDVYSVSNLSYGDIQQSKTSIGMVCDDASQSVYLKDGQVVTDVFVTKGQQVKQGDKLMSYDVTSLSLSIEMKQNEISSYENQLASEKEKLEKLKTVRPVEKIETTDTVDDPKNQYADNQENQYADDYQNRYADNPEDNNENIHNIISDISEAVSGNGTLENPFVYECTSDMYISGALLNQLKTDKYVAVFKNEPAFVVTIYGEYLTEEYAPSEELRLFMKSDTTMDNTNQEFLTDSNEQETEITYTAEELKAAIDEQVRKVSSTDLAKRIAQSELDELNKQLEDGSVYAKADGVVTIAEDPQNPPQDGSVFLQISGKEGLYISGTIAELDLGTVKEGQTITAVDYQTGNYYSGSITNISTTPADGSGYYGENNPNSSYYEYTAYIENPSDLKKGQELELTIETGTETLLDTLYIEQCYVREEEGKSYVYKEENKKLVKQQVETGKSLWGTYVEIKSGITEDDYIAFPYGVNEGEKTKETNDISD